MDWWICTGGSQDLAGGMARLFGAEGATKFTPKLSMLSMLLDVFCEGGDRTTSRPSLEMSQEHVLWSLNLFQTIADEKNYKAFLG